LGTAKGTHEEFSSFQVAGVNEMSNAKDKQHIWDCAMSGKPITEKKALQIYARKSNWKRAYFGTPPKCHWVWKGPIIVGPELAEMTLASSRK
jgi:hypothetical protein